MHFRKEFAFLKERQADGHRTVLVTVCAVEGSSMRNPGSVMGVAEDGSYAGSLSGGCIENAVVSEALDALTAGEPRLVRFGAGSPYLDIKLPCGGGLDLHFAPLNGTDLAALALEAIEDRRPFSISIEEHGARFDERWHESDFDLETGTGVFGHFPRPRLLIIGHGAGVEALASLARTMGCAVEALTPDARVEAELRASDIPVTGLERTGQVDLIESDVWTAIVFLFHDHDWEIELMAHARKLPHFYLGAMGGRQAHALRTEALRGRGISEEQLATIRAPIGVFHSSRDPQTLALSTLAEVIRSYQETDFSVALD